MEREGRCGVRIALWIAGILAVGCGVAWNVGSLRGARERLDAVPLRTADLSGRDLALTETELKVLGRVDLVHRLYQFGGREVFVTLIDGTRDRHAVHDPRYCFRGAGWGIVQEEDRLLAGGTARWLRANAGEQPAEAVFWFSDGKVPYASLGRYLWQTAVRRVTFGRVGEAPVLIVLQAFDGGPLDAATVDRLHRELKL